MCWIIDPIGKQAHRGFVTSIQRLQKGRKCKHYHAHMNFFCVKKEYMAWVGSGNGGMHTIVKLMRGQHQVLSAAPSEDRVQVQQ